MATRPAPAAKTPAPAPAAAPAAEAAAPKAGKRKLFIILGIVIAVLIAGGVGGYLALAKKKTADASDADHETEAKAHPKKTVFSNLDRFTVNLRNPEREVFLQVDISVEMAEKSVEEAIKKRMPAVRSAILLTISGKTAAELGTREGKEKLAAEVADIIRQNIEGSGPTKGVEQVLFTHMIIQ